METDKEFCCRHVASLVMSIILVSIIFTMTITQMAKPNGLLLVVVGGSFQMEESLPGNVTVRFTIRVENPTSCNITYKNISGTVALLNEYGENEGHFLRFNMTEFDVQQPTFVDSPAQVTATQVGIAVNSIAAVLQFNGTMEMNSHNSTAVYRCRIWTRNYDQNCPRVK